MQTPAGNRSLVPQPLLDRYQLEQETARTDEGVVFNATERSSGRRVEIEISARAPAGDGRTRDMTSARRLDGEHVLEVLDAGKLADGSPYVVREPSLTTLADEIARRGPIPEEQAVAWTLEVCEAIAEGHALGMSHGDIRAETVSLARGRDGQPTAKLRWTSKAKSERAGREDVARDIAGAGSLLRVLLTATEDVEAGGAKTLPDELSYAVARATTTDEGSRFRNIGQFVSAIQEHAPSGHGSARNVRFLLSRAGIVSTAPQNAPPHKAAPSAFGVDASRTSDEWGSSPMTAVVTTPRHAPTRAPRRSLSFAVLALLICAAAIATLAIGRMVRPARLGETAFEPITVNGLTDEDVAATTMMTPPLLLLSDEPVAIPEEEAAPPYEMPESDIPIPDEAL